MQIAERNEVGTLGSWQCFSGSVIYQVCIVVARYIITSIHATGSEILSAFTIINITHSEQQLASRCQMVVVQYTEQFEHIFNSHLCEYTVAKNQIVLLS